MSENVTKCQSQLQGCKTYIAPEIIGVTSEIADVASGITDVGFDENCQKFVRNLSENVFKGLENVVKCRQLLGGLMVCQQEQQLNIQQLCRNKEVHNQKGHRHPPTSSPDPTHR